MRFEWPDAQYPVCNPSRTPLLSGLLCEETGIVGNQVFFLSWTRKSDACSMRKKGLESLPQWPQK